MRVHIFRGSRDHVYGFTPEQSGSNLPADNWPWTPFKSIEIYEEHPAQRKGRFGGHQKRRLLSQGFNG